MEGSDEECQQQYVEAGVNQKSFHFINVFILKAYDTCKHQFSGHQTGKS